MWQKAGVFFGSLLLFSLAPNVQFLQSWRRYFILARMAFTLGYIQFMTAKAGGPDGMASGLTALHGLP